jgi:hypothetical protein
MDHSIPCVMTHLFEGPVGMYAAARLASAFGTQRYAHGLGFHPFLECWSTSVITPLRLGRLEVPWMPLVKAFPDLLHDLEALSPWS